MNKVSIIDNLLIGDTEIDNETILSFIDPHTKLELYDYSLTDISQLNNGDNIILIKKTTLKKYKRATYIKHDDDFIYIKHAKEYINDFYIYYKQVYTKKNMFKYLLDALDNNQLTIN